MKKPRQHVEHEIQCAGIAECRKIPGCEWIHAIPNASKGRVKAQIWMNREGRLAGVSDVFLPMPVGRFRGLYIEVKKPATVSNGKKSPAGKLKKEQARFILYTDKAGYAVAVVYSALQMIDICIRYIRGEYDNESAVRLAEGMLKNETRRL